MIENKGNLWFYDSGMKFLGEKHALKNLTRENDICVYSLTPKGEKQPKYLIAKVMQAGAIYHAASDEERYVVMEVMDYEKTDPMNLFTIVKRLNAVLISNIYDNVKETFLRQNGLFRDPLTPQEFFSIEVDPDSDDPGAKIYLQDKANFLCIFK
ncbi:MAG: hypothetical protein IJO53_05315 [Clostridia bacterium]|nr:hypothetical protein [Clostridia bacterium]